MRGEGGGMKSNAEAGTMNDERRAMPPARRSAPVVPRPSFRARRFIPHSSTLRLHPCRCCLLLAAVFFLSAPARAAGAWAEQRSGTFAWLRAVHFSDERAGWAVGGNGALVSTADGGRNWKVRARPTEDTLRDVFFTDALNGWLVCERSVYALARMEEPRSYLLRTADGGETWSRVALTADDAGVLLARVVFATPERGWAFGEMGALYSTRDGGATWQRRRAPTRRFLSGAHFLDASRGWLVGAAGTALRTTDGGETWRALVSPALPRTRLNAVWFADAARGWAVGQGGVVVATGDGGNSWRAQASGTEADLTDVKFLNAREGWAVGAGGTVLRTTDAGETWQAVASRTRHNLERLTLAGRDRLCAVGFGGAIIAYDPSLNENDPRITKTSN